VRCSVRTQAGAPAILRMVFRDFPHSHQANVGTLSIRPEPLLSVSFPIRLLIMIRSFDTVSGSLRLSTSGTRLIHGA
jgi:hypothetical protein